MHPDSSVARPDIGLKSPKAETTLNRANIDQLAIAARRLAGARERPNARRDRSLFRRNVSAVGGRWLVAVQPEPQPASSPLGPQQRQRGAA
jgi:hypothetical protein